MNILQLCKSLRLWHADVFFKKRPLIRAAPQKNKAAGPVTELRNSSKYFGIPAPDMNVGHAST
jgi:hypothetical protein